ncbi:MAG: hypothetical protein ACI9S9_004364 [Planctomycetota bacterium]|jgi:hypothetical protein
MRLRLHRTTSCASFGCSPVSRIGPSEWGVPLAAAGQSREVVAAKRIVSACGVKTSGQSRGDQIPHVVSDWWAGTATALNLPHRLASSSGGGASDGRRVNAY